MTSSAQTNGAAGRVRDRLERLLSALRGRARWREWSLSVKLAVILLVPILAALGAGATVIWDNAATWRVSGEDAQATRVVRADEAVLSALRAERALAVSSAASKSAPSVALISARATVDSTVAQLTSMLAAAKYSGQPESLATTRLAGLPSVRSLTDPVRLISAYAGIDDVLLNLDTTLVSTIHSRQLAELLGGAYTISVASEYLSEQQSLVGVGLTDGALSSAGLALLRECTTLANNWLDQFASTAPASEVAAYSTAVSPPVVAARNAVFVKVLDSAGNFHAVVSTTAWHAVAQPLANQLDTATDQSLSAAGGLAAAADSGHGLWIPVLVLLLAVLLAVVLITAVVRDLCGSLRLLRRETLEITRSRLPEALRQVRDGRAENVPQPRLPIMGNSELGAVAVAFEAVCGEALLAAAEQARTHVGYSQVLVNVFRRSQSLIQRQLQIIEQLERGERAPEQLAKLYQLDHLITRMRRNNENVLVLSGTELARRSTRPVLVGDLVQAAVSEIEQYQRVEIGDLPSVKVADAAAGDLIRVLAEMLDNATSFSAPELNVRVQGAVLPGGSLTISVLDQGIGMSDEEIKDANERLSRVGSAELTRSRQVGLLVVGRLAGRHGFGVELVGGNKVDGVTAVLSVPVELVVEVSNANTQVVGAETRAPNMPTVRRLVAVPALRSTPVIERPPQRKTTRPPAGANSPELVTQAHTDVPADLPVRKPKRPSALPSSQPTKRAEPSPREDRVEQAKAARKRPADRAASRWFRARDTADEPRVASISAEATVVPESPATPVVRKPAASATVDGTASAKRPAGLRESWSSPADAGWDIVETVSRSEQYQYTEDGLPIRERGAHLLPGSAQPNERERIERDPVHTRSRLSSYQQGVAKANGGRRRKESGLSGWKSLRNPT